MASTIGNNWQENRDGEAYRAVFEKGRPALRERADGLRARVAAVNERFAAKYGWDTSGLKRQAEAEEANTLEQSARGTLSFGKDIRSKATISLLEHTDLSTFLHEATHFFLEVQADIASRPNAPPGIVDNMNKALAWMGVKGRMGVGPQGNDVMLTPLEVWRSMTLGEKRASHEKFARAGEVYFFEGGSAWRLWLGILVPFSAAAIVLANADEIYAEILFLSFLVAFGGFVCVVFGVLGGRSVYAWIADGFLTDSAGTASLSKMRREAPLATAAAGQPTPVTTPAVLPQADSKLPNIKPPTVDDYELRASGGGLHCWCSS